MTETESIQLQESKPTNTLEVISYNDEAKNSVGAISEAAAVEEEEE